MNRQMLLGVGTLVVLSLAVFGYALSHKASTNTSMTASPNDAMMNSNQDESESIKDLFVSGKSKECTVRSGDNYSGTVYVNAGHVRGEFTSTSANLHIMSHMISDGKTSYIWMNDDKVGMKTSLDLANQTPNPDPELKNDQGIDLNQKMQFNCQNWTVDNSKFDVPTDVTFTDVSSMKVPTPGSAMMTNDSTDSAAKEARCAACNSAPQEYKEQCLQSMGCI